MSVEMQTCASVGFARVQTVWVPEGYPNVLEEHDTVECPVCQSRGVTIHADVVDCHECWYRWRWVSVGMGLD